MGIKKQTLNILLSMVKLLITLWMVYQYTQSLQRYRHPSELSWQRGRKPLSNGDFKTQFNSCDSRKRRVDQQHCIYSTTVTLLTVKRRKPVQNKNIPKYAWCLQQGTKVLIHSDGIPSHWFWRGWVVVNGLRWHDLIQKHVYSTQYIPE
jgi:hypothetical protein